MKHVDTWLNEEEFKDFKKEADKRKMTNYALTKKLLKDFLKDTKAVGVCIFFWLLCYSLVATTLILV